MPKVPSIIITTILAAILLLFGVISVIGITWGVPSRKIDDYLFGENPVWSGEKIYSLASGEKKFSTTRGADVDVDPIDRSLDGPIPLTATDQDAARIYLRYRLYSYQPDEMITMMALAGMRPRSLQLDPKLYQYGGLFIYPVGGLIGVCGALGLIEVVSDVVFYLDSPDEFGKFYIVARAYSAAWGMVGVLVVFAIARRLGGLRAALPAALLFTIMPVVICMAHEGKPHLPGAVLMLAAVLFAMRHLDRWSLGRLDNRRGLSTSYTPIPSVAGQELVAHEKLGEAPTDKGARSTPSNWWWMCICCGAALGMVLSSWPIFVLIPLVALIDWRQSSVIKANRCESMAGVFQDGASATRSNAATSTLAMAIKQTALGTIIAMMLYLTTNPYIVINALFNPDVLRSNFGNSFAMYAISRITEGFVRVLELTVEGATWPILLLGVIALAAAGVRRNRVMLPLAIPAMVFFLQFVLIGAGKPAEYGRFGIFTNTALAIGAACLLARRWTGLREVVNWVPAILVILWVAWYGAGYAVNFADDARGKGSRILAGSLSQTRLLASKDQSDPTPRRVAVIAEPAPYSCPPLDFSRYQILLFAGWSDAVGYSRQHPEVGAVIRHLERIERPRAMATEHWFPNYALHPKQWLSHRETPISWANKPFEILVRPDTAQKRPASP